MPAASADHCNGAVTVVQVASETAYLVETTDESGEASRRVYLETNDQPGRQEGPSVVPDNPLLEDTARCVSADPDTHMF